MGKKRGRNQRDIHGFLAYVNAWLDELFTNMDSIGKETALWWEEVRILCVYIKVEIWRS